MPGGQVLDIYPPIPEARELRIGEGEKRLIYAVLQDALRRFQKYAGAPGYRERSFFLEEQAWFRSEDRTWPLSFERICETLDYDPSRIRKFLAEELERRGLTNVQPLPRPKLGKKATGRKMRIEVCPLCARGPRQLHHWHPGIQRHICSACYRRMKRTQATPVLDP